MSDLIDKCSGAIGSEEPTHTWITITRTTSNFPTPHRMCAKCGARDSGSDPSGEDPLAGLSGEAIAERPANAGIAHPDSPSPRPTSFPVGLSHTRRDVAAQTGEAK